MNVIILLSTNTDEFLALQNGKNTHARERRPGKERQTERIRIGYDIRFFVEGDIEEKEGVCLRRVCDVAKTNKTIKFELEPIHEPNGPACAGRPALS